MQKHSLVAGILLGAVFVAGSCAAPPSPKTPARSSLFSPSGWSSDVERFTIVMEEAANGTALPTGTRAGERHRWLPDVIAVPKGNTVIITIENRQNITHVFALPDYHVPAVRLGPDDTTIVQFTTDRSGTFPWFCVLHGEADQSSKVRPSDPVPTGRLFVADR
ncbi:MAG: hypothetical protein HY689_12330 [Chloroflexi bacterium]|nr:hypothetical protein [Chloroflexota bacterium]